MFKFMITIALFVSFSSFAQDRVEPIEAFGQGGEYEAFFMGATLSDSFYNTSPAQALGSGNNHAITLTINDGTADGDRARAREILVHNTTKRNNSVVIAAAQQYGSDFEKFVVTLGEYESQYLDITNLIQYDIIYVYSGFAFEAVISDDLDNPPVSGSQDGSKERTTKSFADYCNAIKVNRNLDDGVASREIWIERRIQNVGGQVIKNIDVYFPTADDLALKGNNLAGAPICSYQATYETCAVASFGTCDGDSKQFTWSQIDENLQGSPTVALANCDFNCAGDSTTYIVR